MPDFTAPGAYIEETAFRARSIEGVGTTTALFVGPARSGPVVGTVEASDDFPLLTSLADFERVYGRPAALRFHGATAINYLAHAARTYFQEGGSRLHVARVATVSQAPGDGGATAASAVLAAGDAAGAVAIHATFPGEAGNGTVTLTETATPATAAMLASAPAGSWLRTGGDGTSADFLKTGDAWVGCTDPDAVVHDAGALLSRQPRLLALDIAFVDADGRETAWHALGYDRRHPRWAGEVLSSHNARRLWHPLLLQVGERVDAASLRTMLLGNAAAGARGATRCQWTLSGGSDGPVPTADDYEHALRLAGTLQEVSTVAAPGADVAMQALVAHVDGSRNRRFAVLDPPQGLDIAQVRALRRSLDTAHAALYYPWVAIARPSADPGDGPPETLLLPPSGLLCGIYARTDVERGVHKAPANEVVRTAVGFERAIDRARQDVLNAEGVNCLRWFEGRGHRVWGARTLSSDPQWKYVPVRRHLDYLQSSIERGTQWAVFEPNDERLWTSLRQRIGDFLLAEWRKGALQGTTPEQAFFVRCDRTTMSQVDLDAGRVVCLVGVAPIKPAEFLVFRVGQATAAS